MADDPVTWRDVERIERDVHNLFVTKASAVAVTRLEEKLDTKADAEHVRDLSKRMDRVSASLWALALAIVTASVTFAVTVGGHP